jgi:3-hydroxyisobutyrate dehydrogenase
MDRDRVGVVGQGQMGLPIVRNLMERGFAVIGYRRSGSPELAEAGGTVAASAAEVAAHADYLEAVAATLNAMRRLAEKAVPA